MGFRVQRHIGLATAVGLCACGPGANPETLLDELRVVQIVAAPPELAPGESGLATVTVADPEERGVEVLTWTCTDLGEGCLESAAPLDLWAHVQRPKDEQVQQAVVVPAELAPILAEVPFLVTQVWALACEPGLCPIIDDVARGRATADDLANPDALLKGLPITGVSLAGRFVRISAFAPEERNQNPVYTPDFIEEKLISDAESIELRFVIDDDAAQNVLAWGLASAGGFAMASASPGADGVAEHEWFAPNKRRTARLYVAFEDGFGGSALWRGTVTLP